MVPKIVRTLTGFAFVLGVSTAAGAQESAFAWPACGNINGDERLDLSDAVHLLDYLFLGGPSPVCAVEPITNASEPCDVTSTLAVEAARHGAIADYQIAEARCIESEDGEDLSECIDEAREELESAFELAEDQLEARREICAELGPHDPDIDPEDFVETIDNEYLLLVPGTTWIYEEETDEGTERTQVTVLYERREILGIEATVVRDTVSLDGEVIEDTFDWFAQDVEGNVWYLGEISFNYEDGRIAGTEGSWEAGVEGAKPGIVMPAEPIPGQLYRQEFLVGEAEDVMRVLALDETVEIPLDTYMEVLETEDYTPIEPDAREHKFYAPGVGNVLVVNLETDDRTVLVAKLAPGVLENATLSVVEDGDSGDAHVAIMVKSDVELESVRVLDPDGQVRAELSCLTDDGLGFARALLETGTTDASELAEIFPEGEYRIVGQTPAGQVLTRVVMLGEP